MRKGLLLAFMATLLLSASAEAGWNVQSNKKYHITCSYSNGFLSLGEYQGVSYSIYYQTNSSTPTDDGYWYLTESGSGYAIQNSKSGQYLSWSDVYDPNRYLTLVDEVSSDNERWVLEDHGDYIAIQSVAQPSYYFNLRMNTLLVGTYAGSPTGSNSLFGILDDDGNAIAWSDTSDDAIWNQGKRYLLHNANGYGYAVYDPEFNESYPSLAGYTTGVNGCKNDLYKKEVDATAANNQWSLLHDENGYYLYNTGRGQYISNYANGKFFYFTDEAEPFEVTQIEEGLYAFRLASLNSNSKAYMCAASQNDGTSNWPIAYWEITDYGSQWYVEEVSTTHFDTDDSGSGEGPVTSGYDTTVSWNGEGDSYTFPDWTSNNTGKDGTTSNYYVRATVSGDYLVSFDWTVSSEQDYDTFSASIDGTSLIGSQSGTANGTYEEKHTFSSGTHQLTFTYAKDNIMSGGNDKASVKNLTLTRIVSVEDITIQAEKTDLYEGETLQLTATVSPENANDKSVSWSSSNNDVAIVSSTGLLTAIAPGATTITATANDGSGVKATLDVNVIDPYLSHSDQMVYIRQKDSTVVMIPRDYIVQYDYRGSLLNATLVDGQPLTMTGIIEVTEQTPADLPGFSVYKFNNKFNSQLFTDVISEDPTQSTIHLEAGCIGKWLTASFQFTFPNTKAWVDGVRQRSKKTRQSFDQPITYLLTNGLWKVLKIRQEGSDYVRDYVDYSRKVTVDVDFLTDHPTGEYNVPRIDITLANTNSWSSSNWIGQNGKSYYEDATIEINGGGVYPDMAATPILIKGRGNSSWSNSYSSKNPYHFKFTTKQKPLGMTKGKHWILLANKQSGSLTSNAMGHKVGNMMQTAGTNHIVPVELYINGSYRGAYDLTERVGFSNNSIDMEDETYAAMLELDTYGDETIYRSNAYSLHTKIHIPELGEDETPLDAETIMGDFDSMTNALAQGDDSYLHQVDADYLARFLAACEFIAQREICHPKSVFLYSENVTDGFNLQGNDDTPWVFGPLWDCDWAFGYEGSYSYFIQNAESDFFNSLLTIGSNSTNSRNFWKALRFNSTEVDQLYYQLWYDFMNKGGLDELQDYCDQYYQFAQKAFQHNRNNATSERDTNDYATITANAKDWFSRRAAYIFSNLTPYALPEEKDDDEEIPSLDKMGDVNDDGAITASDVVCVLNSLINLPNDTYLAPRADMNSNGEVSISDVVLLCNRVLEQPASVRRNLHLPQANVSMYLRPTEGEAQSEVMLPVNLCVDEGRYSAMQMDVELPEGIELNDVKLPVELASMTVRTHLMDNGRYRIVVYGNGNQLLPESLTTLQLQLLTAGPTEGHISLTAVSVSTDQGEEERLPSQGCRLIVKDSQTAVSPTMATATQTSPQSIIYDLQGRKVGSNGIRQHGVYIVNGKKVIK